jgi:Uncharacterized protein involved in tellurite resistance
VTQDRLPAAAADTLDPALLTQLGLESGDLVQIQQLAQGLADAGPGGLHVFGSEVAGKSAAFSAQLLDQVRNRDLEASGEKLGEVVRIARTLKLDAVGQRSRLPVIGGLIDRMRASRGELMQKFSDSNAQIEQLMADVGVQQAAQSQRVQEFDRMHAMVRQERHALGLHVAAGKLQLARMEAELAQLAGQEDPLSRTRRNELDHAVRLLDKRIGDLLVMQHAAEQSLPMIRMIQANAIQLIEKFNAVRDITIPSWKRQFAIQLSLQEQKNAVALSNAIDDASNELMRRNADLMRQTSVDTARANQRAVIDLATLRHAHEQMIATVEEVRSIHREGMAQRQQAEQDLLRMREDVQQRLAQITRQG